ncbi:MAG: type II toxin-antitoxin system RelE/ParE family toxin [Pseudomonadota bacterium]|nr:type II toxin-antitoxin system RelE/ParE family toxin [Pseudomonadota bacterium]
MKLTWRPGAFQQLQQIYRYIAQDNPTAAAAVRREIEKTAALLAAYPEMGQATNRPNVYRKLVPGYPYHVFYRVLPDEVRIVSVRDARRRPS